jgi:outer membrane protein OmpA-like peptidoglycan-associated protein
MTMITRLFSRFILVLLSLFVVEQADANDTRWYLTPGVSFITPDANRAANNGTGFQIGIGRPFGPALHLEFTGVSDTLAQQKGTLEFKQQGWLLDGLYFFNRNAYLSPYSVVGAGVLETQFKGEKRHRPMMNLGVGVMTRLWGERVGLRSDFRYRVDERNLTVSTKTNKREERFGDFVINLTFVVPFGEGKSVSTPKSAQPAAQAKDAKDVDGDGIPNNKDACPDSPAGEKVDSNGCELDDDEDGIVDRLDKCPDTAFDTAVDALGCSLKNDRDGDGIIDNKDACPNTPAGEAVNQSGCELDSDSDGVVDSRDLCPNTPISTAVNTAGCSLKNDSDGDGVMDNTDTCPNTPAGEKVDQSGCELDGDSDGVVDSRDICPNTPVGAVVDATGCIQQVDKDKAGASRPANKGDSDKDGVPDGKDACPATPANATVNERGCELDGDNDGIADARDLCPESKAGETVDLAGCKMAKVTVLKGVNFKEGSDRLLPNSMGSLDTVAETLRRNPDVVVEVAGYTDNRGGVAANKKLSKKRAEAVASYLIIKGVIAANVITNGFGPEDPIADNNTPEGRKLNRRVELHILD